MSAHTRAPHGMDWRRRASGRDSAGSTEPCAAFMAILKDGRGSCRPAGRPAGCRRGDGRQSPPVAGRRTALPLRWLPAASGRGAAGRSPGGRTPPPSCRHMPAAEIPCVAGRGSGRWRSHCGRGGGAGIRAGGSHHRGRGRSGGWRGQSSTPSNRESPTGARGVHYPDPTGGSARGRH